MALYGSRERAARKMAVDYKSQQRAVIVALALIVKGELTTMEVAEMTGLTYQGARAMMNAISGPDVPIYRDDEKGRWAIVWD